MVKLLSGQTVNLTLDEVRLLNLAVAFYHGLPDSVIPKNSVDVPVRAALMRRMRIVVRDLERQPVRPGFDLTWRFEVDLRSRAQIVACLDTYVQMNSACGPLRRKFA